MGLKTEAKRLLDIRLKGRQTILLAVLRCKSGSYYFSPPDRDRFSQKSMFQINKSAVLGLGRALLPTLTGTGAGHEGSPWEWDGNIQKCNPSSVLFNL